ncbi:Mevalonate kinase [Astathelohania contejeani]|uniref:Mevalonate kinase n=1 Tax=Astathelohania contejeani TaxID=164912 RepID=A0ABQ7HWS5_9MICR|nr:Mevalonate kinase [Thelohania contejeani]
MNKNVKEIGLSSPAKIILFGEYAVLHGGRCLALAINKRGRILTAPGSGKIYIYDILNNVVELTDSVKSNESNNDIIIELPLRFGCGLGSSAIVSLLLAGYFNRSNKQIDINDKENDHIIKEATKFENIFHGKSSGVDVSTSFHGGFISFKNMVIESLDTTFIRNFKIIIFDSKISKSTASVVNKCDITITIIDEIMNIAEDAYRLMSRPFKLEEIYTLIRKNQDLLEKIGVCPPEMKDEIIKMRKYNIEAKITGSGGGGHLITLVKPHLSFPGWEEVEIDGLGLKQT